MKLTDHFSLAELTHSQTADRLGLDNTPPPEVITRLTATAHGLEMIRALVQCPIHVSSGYRSPAVNTAVRGAKSSQHLTGHAADITAPWFGPPKRLMAAIIKADLPFDQCILEFAGQGGGWVHISFTDHPRGQALVIDHDGTRAWA